MSLSSVAFVVVKLYIFKSFRVRCSIHEMWLLLFWGVSGPFLPQIDPILLKFWPEVISGKANQRQFMNNLPKFCLSRKGTYPKFTVLVVHFWLGQIYLLKTQNIGRQILLKVQTSLKTTFWGISNNASPRPQNFLQIKCHCSLS